MSDPGMPRRRVGALILVCLAVGACAGPAPTTSEATPLVFTDWIALPGTFPWSTPPATPPPCAGVGLDAVLHGDATDPAVTWLGDRIGDGRIEVTWPVGFRARFAPDLVVVDPAGRIVHREGDAIDGGCVDGDRILLGYP